MIEVNHTTTAAEQETTPSGNWEQFAREGRADHLASESICILACHEYDQNGPSEMAA